MSMFKSTILAYDYFLDKGLFSEMKLPAGIDRQTLIDTILIECGEMCPVWTNPSYMRDMIGVWSNKWYHTFERWIKAINFDYEPLYNYDRYEDISEQRTGEETRTGKDNRQISGTNASENSGTVTGTNAAEVTNSRSAYDSSTFAAHDKTNTTGSDSSTSKSIIEGRENTLDVNDHMDTGRSADNMTHKGHMYGNIGVTTSQQMLKDELEVSAWNVYEHIKDVFMQEFCIMIY